VCGAIPQRTFHKNASLQARYVLLFVRICRVSLQERLQQFNQIIRKEDFLDDLDIGRRAIKMYCKVMESEYLYLPGSL
jgi:hypothetical protein